MNLHDVFTNEHAQRALIARGAEALHAIGGHVAGGHLFGQHGAAKPQAATPSPVTGARLLQSPVAAVVQCGQIAGYYQQLAAVERSKPVLLFAALSMLVLLPLAAADVCAATQSDLAPFFHGGAGHASLRRRFELYMTGTADRSALLPLQMVVAEQQLFRRLG